MSRILSNVFVIYKKILDHHPLKVQCVQTAILMGAGDVIAQAIVEKKTVEYDFLRTLRFAVLGGVIGPSLYIWYSILDKYIGKSVASTLNMTAQRWDKPLLKVAIDQGVFAPVFLAVFISSNSLLEGKGVDQIKNRLQEDYPDILIANYKVWPCVQIVNFSIIPLQYRVLFLQTIALAWNTYLAWRLNIVKTEMRFTPP